MATAIVRKPPINLKYPTTDKNKYCKIAINYKTAQVIT